MTDQQDGGSPVQYLLSQAPPTHPFHTSAYHRQTPFDHHLINNFLGSYLHDVIEILELFIHSILSGFCYLCVR